MSDCSQVGSSSPLPWEDFEEMPLQDLPVEMPKTMAQIVCEECGIDQRAYVAVCKTLEGLYGRLMAKMTFLGNLDSEIKKLKKTISSIQKLEPGSSPYKVKSVEGEMESLDKRLAECEETVEKARSKKETAQTSFDEINAKFGNKKGGDRSELVKKRAELQRNLGIATTKFQTAEKQRDEILRQYEDACKRFMKLQTEFSSTLEALMRDLKLKYNQWLKVNEEAKELDGQINEEIRVFIEKNIDLSNLESRERVRKSLGMGSLG